MPSSVSNNKRIAKNTLILYFRMLLTMGVSLYTSRVILEALGVADYGIYNVVGGIVAMFGILSGSLSSAISRFITFELGKGDFNRLKRIFSTSVNIQIILIAIIVVLMETIGLWFLNYKMVIPEGRLVAANWVFQFSVVTFAINLLSVPYNAVIVAHEKMSAFAYISIVDCTLKLIVAFVIAYNPFDRLVYYGVLIMIVGLINRSIYAIYSKRHFEEATYSFLLDTDLMKEMFGFAGWNFLANGAYMLNTQGVNVIINIFFGVTVNAARGIAEQVNHAVQSFVSSFSTAINPQITKSFANGDKETAFDLVYKGAKYAFLLMLVLSLPILFETETILKLWLKKPPEYSISFVRWTILGTMTTTMGNTLLTLVLAHGNIKKYQIFITLFGVLPFPMTWLAFKLHFDVIYAYIIYFVVYYGLIYVRLYLVHDITGIPWKLYIKKVVFRTHVVCAASVLAPYYVVQMLTPSMLRLVITCVVSVISSCFFSFFLGMTKNERVSVISKVNKYINSKIS